MRRMDVINYYDILMSLLFIIIIDVWLIISDTYIHR